MPGRMTRRSISVGLFALLASGCDAACGETAPPTTRHDDRLWRPYAWTPARRPFGFGGWREFAVLDLPWAGSPGPDLEVDRNRPRFLVNVGERGMVMFKGKRWSLRSGERATVLESLAQRIQSSLRRCVNGGESTCASLRCDYHAAFGDVHALLATLGAALVSLEHFAFAVASSDETSWLEAKIHAELVRNPRPDAKLLPVEFEMIGPVDSREAAPRVKIGGRALAFAAGEPYAAGAANELANAHWRAVRADLRQARVGGVTAVELGVGAQVPWAYVAMMLGLMLDAGIQEVRLEGTVYRLSTPAPAPAGDVDRGALKDWSPAFALGLGVAGALAVFALGALTSRRRTGSRGSS